MNHHLPLAGIRALLIDISGTLMIGSQPIPGAVEALAKLRAARIPFRLCSNTSKESSDAIHARMQVAGLDVHRTELWTSIGALRAALNELEVKRPYTLLSPSALEECTLDHRSGAPVQDQDQDQGLQGTDALRPLTGTTDETTSAPSSDSSEPASLIPYDAVVVGLAPTLLDYAHLNTAFRILVGENRSYRDAPVSDSYQFPLESQRTRRTIPPLIALHKARYLQATDHARSLGPGPFVCALEEAAQTSAIVVGKPTRGFFEIVLRDLDRDIDLASWQPSVSDSAAELDYGHEDVFPGNQGGVAVIGDDVHADLGEGAVELGLWRVLVKTGKYRPGDERPADGPVPDQICASFAEFVETLLEQRQTQV